MPRRLREYGWKDWLRLRPFSHTLKTTRYRRIDQRFLTLQTPLLDELAIGESIQRRPVIATIAFNDSELIELQLPLVAKYIQNAVHIVADNSTDELAAQRIERLCFESSIAYVKLPENPWTKKNPSRSHGLAMNWVWRHIVLPNAPYQFGFIDHDLFPLADDDPFSNLGSSACWGDKRWSNDRWFLWAGFCFFDIKQVQDLPLDFGLDWFAGLDSGGANWEVLYQHLNPASLRDRDIREVPVWPNVPLRNAYFEYRDNWIHEVGLAGDRKLRNGKRDVLKSLLAAHL